MGDYPFEHEIKISDIDKDGDSQIDFDEFLQWMWNNYDEVCAAHEHTLAGDDDQQNRETSVRSSRPVRFSDGCSVDRMNSSESSNSDGCSIGHMESLKSLGICHMKSTKSYRSCGIALDSVPESRHSDSDASTKESE